MVFFFDPLSFPFLLFTFYLSLLCGWQAVAWWPREDAETAFNMALLHVDPLSGAMQTLCTASSAGQVYELWWNEARSDTICTLTGDSASFSCNVVFSLWAIEASVIKKKIKRKEKGSSTGTKSRADGFCFFFFFFGQSATTQSRGFRDFNFAKVTQSDFEKVFFLL